ncbi:hypothetical protein C0Q70_02783 [Pomacea canaliculata]|uniref:Doublecortin domain-containing protein n=1 Tax=Pomacea canaliculata TaxID=400727 RepID=A0A2T7PQW2_POMCA|nr:hypothetical protein C0Q70_02783 [Pomacea canaliculata]
MQGEIIRGKKLYITPHKYYNFNDLLNDLTGKLPSSINLPYGVRQIFTPVGGRRISDIDDLQDGETYVCAGFEGFKTIKYGRTELEPWSVGKPMRPLNSLDGELGAELSYGSYKYRGYVANAFHPGRYYRGNGNPPNRRWPGGFASTNQRFPAGLLGGPMEAGHLKPKVITIVRNGSQPLSNVKILLNRRSVQSFEQLLADINEAFGSKWRKNRVCKMFTTHGREVKGVADFFREEDCFIAVGSEGLSERDVADIIEELYPDSAYAKVLLKDWDKQRRHNNKGGLTNRESEQGDKRDSGFVDGSDTNSNSHREQDYASPPAPRQSRLRRSKRAAAAALMVSAEPDSSASFEAISPHNDHHFLNKIEKERLRVSNDERDKARKRHHRATEQERRTLDEERRRRGLLPLNPLKPLEDIPRKEVREKEREDGQRKKEEMKKVEEEEEEGGRE